MFPERFSNLPAYAFPRLRALLDHHDPGGPVLHMSIGEPKHPFPAWITEIIARHAADFGRYPPNEGTAELRAGGCLAKGIVNLDGGKICYLSGTG